MVVIIQVYYFISRIKRITEFLWLCLSRFQIGLSKISDTFLADSNQVQAHIPSILDGEKPREDFHMAKADNTNDWQKLPAHIEAMFGEPPVLSTESRAIYESILFAIRN